MSTSKEQADRASPREEPAPSTPRNGRALRLQVVQPDGLWIVKEFTRYPVRVGRGAECEVVLHDENVSRLHAEFLLKGDRFFVRDCHSLNGIRLNREMVVEASVVSGDTVEIGRCELQVLEEEFKEHDDEASSDEVNVRPDGTGGVLEVVRAIDIDKLLGDKLPLQHQTPPYENPFESEEVRLAVKRVNRAYTNLMIIMNLISRVGSYSHPDQVCEQFVTALKKVFPLAENVAVIEFVDRDSGSGRILHQAGFSGDDVTHSRPSATVLKRVGEELRAIYAVDARKDPRFNDSDSMLMRGVRSMMCAPLLSRGEAYGALYVENLSQPYCFGQFDLNFLTVFAFHLGIALETSRLLAERDRAFEQAVESIKAVRQDKTALLVQYSQSERKFRALFEQSALGAAVINLVTGRIEEVNDGLVRMLGYGKRQLAGLNLWDILPGKARAQAEEWLVTVRQQGEGSFKSRLVTSSGNELIALQSCRALRLGESLVMVAYFIDITDKERAEAQTKTQLLRVTALSELSQALMTTMNPEAIYRLLFQKVLTVLPLDEYLMALFTEEEDTSMMAVFIAHRTASGKMEFSTEHRPVKVESSLLDHLQKREESAAYFASSQSGKTGSRVSTRNPYELRPGNFLASSLIVPLISRHKRRGLVCVQSREPRAYDSSHVETFRALVAQAALALSNAHAFRAIREQETSLRRLSLQIMTAQETERGRISRELHDGVGQQLTAMKYLLETIRSSARNDDRGKLDEAIGDARTLAMQIIDELRSISLDLRPTMLDDLGLQPTLEWLSREYAKRHNIPIALDCNLEGLEPAPEISTSVYRIVQEGLGNVAKHSKAKHVDIRVHVSRGTLKIDIVDDGMGFDSTALPQMQLARGCSGMLNMKERARFLGGDFHLETAPGNGTKLRVTIPVKETDSSWRRNEISES